MKTSEIKYLLIPQWTVHTRRSDKSDDIIVSHEIPTLFVKLFNSKKEIENYLNANTNDEHKSYGDKIYHKIYNIMLDEINNHPKYKDNPKESLRRSFDWREITFWVIGVNSVGKENVIGIVQKEYGYSNKWKYRSYFGGKVWKDDLLGGIYI